MSKAVRSLVICLSVIILVIAAAPAAAQEESNRREAPDLEERIFTIRHGDISNIYRMIRPFITPYGKANADRSSSIIVLRDTPETITRIAEIIARIDIPPDNIRLTFFVFTASKEGGEDLPDDLPERVQKGLKEMGKVMAYKSFRLVDRGMLTLVSSASHGELRINSDRGFEIGISFSPKYNVQSKLLKLERLSLTIIRGESVSRLMRTDVGIENGGVSVVGASRINGGDEALLAIVTMDVRTIGQ